MSEELQEFFAVTLTSVYHAQAGDPATGKTPIVTKIALRGESSVPVGGTLQNGTMLAICSRLHMYIPEGGGITSYERRIERVNMRWWGGHTSEIVALFRTKKEALACFASNSLVECDPRWAEQTLEVVNEIGDNHPTFTVCRYPGLALPLIVPAETVH